MWGSQTCLQFTLPSNRQPRISLTLGFVCVYSPVLQQTFWPSSFWKLVQSRHNLLSVMTNCWGERTSPQWGWRWVVSSTVRAPLATVPCGARSGWKLAGKTSDVRKKPICQELICINVLLCPTQICVGAWKKTPDLREGSYTKDWSP